jgi:hypothetical protein
MQTAHELASRALPTNAPPTVLHVGPADDPNPRPPMSSMARQPESRIETLWERMLAMYGHTWASQNGSKSTGITADTWAGVLNGLSAEQLAAGLHACAAEGREFPPSAPRFRAMCLGVPSFARVQLELDNLKRHRVDKVSRFSAAVYSQLDGYAYAHASARDAERMLQRAYDYIHEEVMNGVGLPPEPAGAIEKTERAFRPASEEVRQRSIEEIRQLLHFSEEEAVAMGEEGMRRAVE